MGDGSNRWPAVHRLDVARMVGLALEKAPAGPVVHGASEEGVSAREIAEVIGRRLEVPVTPVAPDDVASHFGRIGSFFGLDIPASSTLTQDAGLDADPPRAPRGPGGGVLLRPHIPVSGRGPS